MQGIHTQHRAGVTVVCRATMGWQVEDTASFVPNVVSFLCTSGARLWYIVGAYMPPNDVPAVHCAEQTLRAVSKGLEVILMGDLNAHLEDPREEREEDLKMVLVDRGMVKMADNFMP